MRYLENPYAIPGPAEFYPADVTPHLTYNPLNGLGDETKAGLSTLPPILINAAAAAMGYVLRSGRLDFGAAPFALMGAGVGYAVGMFIKDQPVVSGAASFAASWWFYDRTGIGEEGGLILRGLGGAEGGSPNVDPAIRQLAEASSQGVRELRTGQAEIRGALKRLSSESEAHRKAVRRVAQGAKGDPYQGFSL